MNRNTVIGFILIAAIMIFYTVYMTPSKEEMKKREHAKDSIEQAKKAVDESQKTRNKEKEVEKVQPLQSQDTIKQVHNLEPGSDDYTTRKNKYSVFANSSVGKKQIITVETEKAIYEIDTKGGFIYNATLKDYKTYDSLPLKLFNPDYNQFGLTFFTKDNRVINTEDFFFKPSDSTTTSLTVSDKNKLTLSMRLYADKGEGQLDTSKYIEFLYTFKGNEYMFDFTINMVNMSGTVSRNASTIDLKWNANVLQQEKSIDRFNGSTVYYKYYQDDVDYLSERKDDEKQIKTRLRWISFKQRFFCSAIIAKNYFDGGKIGTFELKEHPFPRYLKSMNADLTVPISFTGNTSVPLSFYLGPNKFYTLKKYDLELERQIPIGWSFFLLGWINQYIVIPVFNWLGDYGWNYGIVILILTIMLKIVLFPIAYKTYMSSAKMRVLKPEVDEINKKFPKKEDAMKKQQAVMALYKKAGANPASGCVPMLLQMPILFAMFRFFPSSIELRQQPFLWAHDLSSYDSIAHLPFNIPFYGDHVSLFTLLMTISTILYTYLNNQMMGQQSTQMPGMKTMMYIMPIMFLGIFNSYASGLSYYYFLANIITFGQMFVFRYALDEDKLRAKIEANKKKPAKKKSGFQKRLEEAAKKRGYRS